jgi:serine/threonine protein kinase
MIQHANIINCKEIFVSPCHVFIIMELMGGGDLFERIGEFINVVIL